VNRPQKSTPILQTETIFIQHTYTFNKVDRTQNKELRT